jgi:hypothetical protein
MKIIKDECAEKAVFDEIRKLRAQRDALVAALDSCFFAIGRRGGNTIDGPMRAEWEQARAALRQAKGE